jgi:hypothetical protein
MESWKCSTLSFISSSLLFPSLQTGLRFQHDVSLLEPRGRRTPPLPHHFFSKRKNKNKNFVFLFLFLFLFLRFRSWTSGDLSDVSLHRGGGRATESPPRPTGHSSRARRATRLDRETRSRSSGLLLLGTKPPAPYSARLVTDLGCFFIFLFLFIFLFHFFCSGVGRREWSRTARGGRRPAYRGVGSRDRMGTAQHSAAERVLATSNYIRLVQ